MIVSDKVTGEEHKIALFKQRKNIWKIPCKLHSTDKFNNQEEHLFNQDVTPYKTNCDRIK